MQRTKLGFALLALLALTACEEPDRYPISGAECGPNDPVKTLDCRVPA